MFCSRCGKPINPAGAFCGNCGASVLGLTAASAVTTVNMTRPTAVTVLAALQFTGGALWALFAVVLLIVGLTATSSPSDGPTLVLMVLGFGALSAYQIICGLGLWRLRSYGRTMLLISAPIGLLGVPIGTIISIIILVYLCKPGIKVLFSGKRAEELDAVEVAGVQAVTTGSGGMVIVVVAVAVCAVFLVAIIAAIAVPGLLRARISGNEASAIGTLRAISSAETTYAATANGGYYDSQKCLVHPTQCVPGFSGGPFLAQEYDLKSGYRFELHGDRLADLRPGTSMSSLRAFSVVAVPVSSSTGTRIFCVDDSGVVRAAAESGGIYADATFCPSAWLAIE
jgi:hypothetical protein